MVDGAVDFSFGEEELRGGVMSGGNFFDGAADAGARFAFEAGDVGEIDGVVVNGETRNVVIAADGLDLRRGDGRRIAGVRCGG